MGPGRPGPQPLARRQHGRGARSRAGRRWELPVAPLSHALAAHPDGSEASRGRLAAQTSADAFASAAAPSVVAVVDDVYTTGATAAAAAAALRRAGARAVHVVTFARAVRR